MANKLGKWTEDNADDHDVTSRFHAVCADRVEAAVEAAFPYGADREDIPEYRKIVRRAVQQAVSESPRIHLQRVEFNPFDPTGYSLKYLLSPPKGDR